jgi:NAD(P)-dependent dehydrogenase (short-subunit alcohol dehydrogenase family)
MNESILITGANIGLGKETARQLALREETKKGSPTGLMERRTRLRSPRAA